MEDIKKDENALNEEVSAQVEPQAEENSANTEPKSEENSEKATVKAEEISEVDADNAEETDVPLDRNARTHVRNALDGTFAAGRGMPRRKGHDPLAGGIDRQDEIGGKRRSDHNSEFPVPFHRIRKTIRHPPKHA